MDKCGHCAYWANNSFTGTSSCRLTKRDDVGYFAPSCEHFERREQPTKTKETMETTEIANTAPQTKVCKICGRELPLDSFPKHPRTKDGHTTICADCFRTKNAASIQKAIDARKTKKTKETSIDGKEFDAAQRAVSLKRDQVRDQGTKPKIKIGFPPELEKCIKEERGHIDKITDDLMKQLMQKVKPTMFTDRELYDELRRRGWTGTLTRTETLE